MALQVESNSSSVVARAACQSSLVRSLCLYCFEKLSTRCLRQYACAEPGNQVPTSSKRPFWRSERKVTFSVLVMKVGRLLFTIEWRFLRNQSQLLSFSALTMAKASGNSCPRASTPVAASRIPPVFRCEMSSVKSEEGSTMDKIINWGLVWDEKSMKVCVGVRRSRLKDNRAICRVGQRVYDEYELPGLVSRSFSQYWGNFAYPSLGVPLRSVTAFCFSRYACQ